MWGRDEIVHSGVDLRGLLFCRWYGHLLRRALLPGRAGRNWRGGPARGQGDHVADFQNEARADTMRYSAEW